MLHAKAIVVDGRCVSLGSANLNYRSYRFSKESDLVFDDPKAASKVMPELEELMAKSRPVSLYEAIWYRGSRYQMTWLLMQVFG